MRIVLLITEVLIDGVLARYNLVREKSNEIKLDQWKKKVQYFWYKYWELCITRKSLLFIEKLRTYPYLIVSKEISSNLQGYFHIFIPLVSFLISVLQIWSCFVSCVVSFLQVYIIHLQIWFCLFQFCYECA